MSGHWHNHTSKLPQLFRVKALFPPSWSISKFNIYVFHCRRCFWHCCLWLSAWGLSSVSSVCSSLQHHFPRKFHCSEVEMTLCACLQLMIMSFTSVLKFVDPSYCTPYNYWRNSAYTSFNSPVFDKLNFNTQAPSVLNKRKPLTKREK